MKRFKKYKNTFQYLASAGHTYIPIFYDASKYKFHLLNKIEGKY